jgi:hypothetical protein
MILPSENMRSPNHLIFLVILLLLLSGCDKPTLTGVESDKIDTSQDPMQKPITSTETMIVELRNNHFTLTPVAEYKLAGRVVGKKLTLTVGKERCPPSI